MTLACRSIDPLPTSNAGQMWLNHDQTSAHVSIDHSHLRSSTLFRRRERCPLADALGRWSDKKKRPAHDWTFAFALPLPLSMHCVVPPPPPLAAAHPYSTHHTQTRKRRIRLNLDRISRAVPSPSIRRSAPNRRRHTHARTRRRRALPTASFGHRQQAASSSSRRARQPSC